MSLKASSPNLQYYVDQVVAGIDYAHLDALCGVSGLGDGDSESAEEAHKVFMSSYRKIFRRPKKAIARIPLPSNYKPPIERSLADQQVIRRTLNAFSCLPTLLSNQELQQIYSIAILESWEREQTIFGHNGLHLVLKGAVRLFPREAYETDALGVGGCFGSLEGQDTCEPHTGGQGAVTLDNCEILRIPRTAHARLRQEIEAQNSALRESIIQSCPSYLHWRKLSIKKLSDLVQMRQLPAKHVLVREGEVCPFVTYIRTGECNIFRDIGGVLEKNPGKKGTRVKYVAVGKLGPGASFGETSVLLDRPSTCSVVSATELKMGVILPGDLKGLDSVTRSLIEQTEWPAYGKLSQEQMSKMYVAQERQKEWLSIKKRVLRDALFYNGIVEGSGKWNQSRDAIILNQLVSVKVALAKAE